jgi:hypothetical protein
MLNLVVCKVAARLWKVKPSKLKGYFIYRQVLTYRNSKFCLQRAFVAFAWTSEQATVVECRIHAQFIPSWFPSIEVQTKFVTFRCSVPRNQALRFSSHACLSIDCLIGTSFTFNISGVYFPYRARKHPVINTNVCVVSPAINTAPSRYRLLPGVLLNETKLTWN